MCHARLLLSVGRGREGPKSDGKKGEGREREKKVLSPLFFPFTFQGGQKEKVSWKGGEEREKKGMWTVRPDFPV